jgi:glycosyltransferase involved in cell wall biosynthesis
MKVLQIINSLGTGGAEKLILDTLPLYRYNDIVMDVLLLWDNDSMFKKELEKTNCCKIFILNKSNSQKTIYNPFSIFKISKIIKNYDVVHVHLFPAQYYVIFANFINKNKAKLIFTEHNTSNTRMESTLLKGIDKLSYKGYEKIITITNDVNLILQKYLKSNTQKIVTIENGVNLLKVTQAIPKKNNQILEVLTDENKLIIQVSSFRTQKDQDTVIKALQLLPIKFHLLLVGDGERKTDLEILVNELGLNDRVHFLGIRKDVFILFKTCDYVVVSSHWEGFGLAAVEGMAANKPVLASNVKGLKEVVDGAGILFEKGNEKQLASIIKELDIDANYSNKVAQACLKRSNQFDISIMVSKHIQIYREVYAKA